MRLFQLLSVPLLVITLYACGIKKEAVIDWDVPVNNQRGIVYPTISLDSFYLDVVSTSFNGSIHVWKDKLLFVDSKFCWVFVFDTTGKSIGRRIGQGEGPNELPCKKIAAYVPLRDGGHLFIGPSWDVYVFDSSFIKKSDFLIDWHPRGNKEYIAGHPDPTDPIMYSITYGMEPIRSDKSTVYLPIYSQHKIFFPATDAYANDARILGKLSIKKGDVSSIYGRLSPIYRRNAQVRTFSYPVYDLIDEDKMVIGFPADSLLYLSDRDFVIKSAFGRMGRDMDTDYLSTTDYTRFNRQWQKENKERGYYTGVDYVPGLKLILRTYQKGGSAISDGLQIYKDNTLIADVDIPAKARVVGYIAPYVYLSAGPDETEEKIQIFRFKLSI